MILLRILKFNDEELCKVCKIGDTELLKYYLRKDLDFNVGFSRGLLGACKHEYIEIVRLMIKNGANNFNHGSHVACRGGYIERDC